MSSFFCRGPFLCLAITMALGGSPRDLGVLVLRSFSRHSMNGFQIDLVGFSLLLHHLLEVLSPNPAAFLCVCGFDCVEALGDTVERRRKATGRDPVHHFGQRLVFAPNVCGEPDFRARQQQYPRDVASGQPREFRAAASLV